MAAIPAQPMNITAASAGSTAPTQSSQSLAFEAIPAIPAVPPSRPAPLFASPPAFAAIPAIPVMPSAPTTPVPFADDVVADTIQSWLRQREQAHDAGARSHTNDARVLELGPWTGTRSAWLLEHVTKHRGTLDCVDTWLGWGAPGQTPAACRDAHQAARDRMRASPCYDAARVRAYRVTPLQYLTGRAAGAKTALFDLVALSHGRDAASLLVEGPLSFALLSRGGLWIAEGWRDDGDDLDDDTAGAATARTLRHLVRVWTPTFGRVVHARAPLVILLKT